MSTSGRTLQHQSAAFVTPLLQTSRTFVRTAVPAMGEVAKAGEAHVHLADLLDREVGAAETGCMMLCNEDTTLLTPVYLRKYHMYLYRV